MSSLPMMQLSLFEELREGDPARGERRELQSACRRLVREAGLRPPIDPRVLASMRKIAQITIGSQPFAGFLYQRDDGRYAVRLRAQDGHTRRRFTLFHEIAHTLLPGFGNTAEYRCNETSAEPKEQLANYAAAELLFPYTFFEGDLVWEGRRGLTTRAVEILARRYEASIEATAIHATDNWQTPATLIVAREPPFPRESTRMSPQLVVSFTHKQGDWPGAPTPYAVLESGALQHALQHAPIDRHLTFDNHGQPSPARISAKAYPYTKDGRKQNRVIALLTPNQ